MVRFNLPSLFESDEDVDMETIRLFISSNRSLESLSLIYANFVGTSKGPPVNLFNIKSFRVDSCPKIISAIVHIPAFHHFGSQWATMGVTRDIRCTPLGTGITLSTKSILDDIAGAWHDLTEYA